MKKIELLAPAKDAEHGRIAIDFGADALYIGGARFGARQAATNSTEDIAKLTEYAHAYGVKVYAALNTVIFDNELEDAKRTAIELVDAGVDALIVQDMSFLRMGLSGVELHASTQTTNTSSNKVRFLSDAGFSRVILERGLSLAQIEKICKSTDCNIECFVHGAICVGNSGECYLSRSQGSRSGNRGECSQSCRMSYDLIDDNNNIITRSKHLLSVKDMNLTPRLEQLLLAGVSSFKIEGRLKDSHYIKNVVGHYRTELDRIFKYSKGQYGRSSEGRTIFDFEPDPERAFTRGGSLYYIDGKYSGVGSPDTPKAIGKRVGIVSKVDKEWFSVKGSDTNLASGDGICIIYEGESYGTNINIVENGRIYPNKIEIIKEGSVLYRNYDHKFSQIVERSRTRRIVDTTAIVKLSDKALTLTVCDNIGNEASESLNEAFEPASNAEKMEQTLKTQIGKSGDTIFCINNIILDLDGNMPFIPVNKINDLRRRVLELLYHKRATRKAKPTLKSEDMEAKYPSTHLGGEGNVTNAMAKEFYTDHGVTEFDVQLETAPNLTDAVVMTTPYCIRREMKQCLKEKRTTLRSELFLKRGNLCYALQFDCKECVMKLIKK